MNLVKYPPLFFFNSFFLLHILILKCLLNSYFYFLIKFPKKRVYFSLSFLSLDFAQRLKILSHPRVKNRFSLQKKSYLKNIFLKNILRVKLVKLSLLGGY